MTKRAYRTGPSLQAGFHSPPSTSRTPPARRRWLWAVSATTAMLLAACGGGDDGSGGPQDYAIRTAMGHWLNDTGTWIVSGKGPGGQSYSVNILISPMAPGAVPIVGGTAARSLQTFTATIDGATVEGALTYYFDPASLSFIASDNGTGGCSVTTANTAVPSSARVGASGAVFTDSNYDGCTAGAAVVATTTSTWSLETTAGIVLVCLKQTALDLAGVALAAQSTCIEIAPDGSLGSKARLVVSAAGATLIDARNF